MALEKGDKSLNRGPWLHAWHDPLAGLKTITPLVRLADLNGDGDNKLILCDVEKKLKVYKGTSLIVEQSLLDFPVSLCPIQNDNNSPRIPSIAVAAGSHVFLYKHMKPFKKWSCPFVETCEAEIAVWEDLRTDNIRLSQAISQLIQARDAGNMLTSRSLDLLLIEDEAKMQDYVNEWRHLPHSQQTIITCMEVLKKDGEDDDDPGLLVVGAESGHVFILPLDPSGSAFICRLQLPSVPVILNCSGLFDTEWRVMVACRDGKVYNIKEGEVRGTALLTGNVIDTSSSVIAMARQDKQTWIATMDQLVSCYTLRGKRSAVITIIDADVVDICMLNMKRLKIASALLVAMSSGELRMYNENKLIYKFSVDRPVSALRFGTFGREDNTLAIVHGRNGSITVKMLRRTMDLDVSGGFLPPTGPPSEQDIPLQIPKKTKIFVEQTEREREKASAIHRAFQRDLCKMRLDTARSYVKILTDEGSSFVGSEMSSSRPEIRIHVQVKGLGPRFLLSISLQNVGQTCITGSDLVLAFDANLYAMGHATSARSTVRNILPVPILLPGPKHIIEAEVVSIDDFGRAAQIMIFLVQALSPVPLLSATVRMPVSEPSISLI